MQRCHAGIVAEQSVGQGVTLGDRDRCQVDVIGDIANGVDMPLRCLPLVVDDDRAVGVGRHARQFQPETGGVWFAAGGEEHQIGGEGLAIAKAQHALFAVGREAFQLAAGVQDDALRAERFRQRLADVAIKPRNGSGWR